MSMSDPQKASDNDSLEVEFRMMIPPSSDYSSACAQSHLRRNQKFYGENSGLAPGR